MWRGFAAEVAVGAGVRLGVLLAVGSLWQLAALLLVGPSGTSALAASVVAAVLAASVLATVLVIGGCLGPGGLAPQTGRVAAFRTKSWSAAFVRQRDPDAAGRRRPRAPSPAPAAA